MLSNFFTNLLVPLILTEVIEIIVAFLFKYRNKNAVLAILLVNLVTNPILNYILYINNFYNFIDSNAFIMIAEIIIIFIEWGLLSFTLRDKSKKLFLLSLTMNIASYLVSYLLWALLVIPH